MVLRIGKAASIFEDRWATLVQSFGPEARGSACSATLAVSEGEVFLTNNTEDTSLVFIGEVATPIYTLDPGFNLIMLPFDRSSITMASDLVDWEYLHQFLEDDRFSLLGDDGACPYFWPLGDQHMQLFFSHKSGGQYLLGDYDRKRERFVARGGPGQWPVRPCRRGSRR